MPTAMATNPCVCKKAKAGALPVNILIIDDSEVDAMWLKRLAEEQGHTAESVPTVADIDKLDTSKYDLAIVDLYMPEFDPNEVLDKARELKCPFVIMTGSTDPKTAKNIGKEEIGLVIKQASNFQSLVNYAIGLAEAARDRAQEMDELRQLSIFQIVGQNPEAT